MKTKHRGYALIEVLIIIFSLVVLIALAVKPMRETTAEIPRINRVFRTWNVTSKALETLKRDVEQSEEIVGLQDNILTLGSAAGQITYGFDQGRLLRRMSGDSSVTAWTLPHVKINPRLWEDGGKPYALEITTWHEQPVRGQEQVRLKQSYVYFRKGSMSQ